MAYERVNWQDLPSTTTPRNATNLNKMDVGIKTNDDKLLGNAPMGNVVVDSIRTKNMFDKDAIITPGYLDNSGNLVTTDATLSCGSIFIPVKPSTTYTISSSSSTVYRIAYYNSSKTFISRIFNDNANYSYSFTTPSNCYYIKMAGTLTSVLGSLQIEEGSATTYSPYQELNTYDTGWVDLSSYVNTTYFTIRPGFNPMARRIGTMVFLKGSVYCSTAVSSYNISILTNIPTEFRPPEEISGAGVHYNLGRPYKIFVENGNINVSEGANIPTTQYYQGYALSDVGTYLAS